MPDGVGSRSEVRTGFVSAEEEGWLRGVALIRQPRVGQGRHVLGGSPQHPHDLVVGGGHQDERQQEDDDHLIYGDDHTNSMISNRPESLSIFQQ